MPFCLVFWWQCFHWCMPGQFAQWLESGGGSTALRLAGFVVAGRKQPVTFYVYVSPFFFLERGTAETQTALSAEKEASLQKARSLLQGVRGGWRVGFFLEWGLHVGSLCQHEVSHAGGGLRYTTKGADWSERWGNGTDWRWCHQRIDTAHTSAGMQCDWMNDKRI